MDKEKMTKSLYINNEKNWKCKECKYTCNALHYQRNFKNWTSGNKVIDKFIQDIQISAHGKIKAFEWIPYNKFNNIEYTLKEFGEVYRATWTKNMFIILKILENPDDIASEFMNEATINHKFYGITQDPKKKKYMFVLDDICEKCNYVCESIHFQQNFKNWTSGNNDIDKLIQSSQLSAHSTYEIRSSLEWIPYNKFFNIEYIAKGGFGRVYKANRIDRHKKDKNIIVALKFLDNSKNVTLKFMNEITLHYKEGANNGFIVGFYGITQEPKTKNYVMVLEYAKNGSLRNYLDINYHKLSWKDKIYHILNIACGVLHIHENELIHRDLHIGNILMTDFDKITDMGLCKPADYDASKNTKNSTYGPYIAPEILRGQNYTKASDIYSFGIIMYEMISGLPPYRDVSHDENLAIKICQGLRPRFNIKVPQLILHLIKRCLDANPLNRPTANEIQSIIEIWRYKPSDEQTTELQRQIKEAEEINNNLLTCNEPTTHLRLSYETHSEAIYTSRLLNFNNLPEPKNSDDYYEHYDNITSTEYSESLQIDVSQSNIIEDDQNINSNDESQNLEQKS
ncbi:unnamed protein product [Rhizophagus irregularis]|nr:unnamed protein product [Rhizophagus irregularis]